MGGEPATRDDAGATREPPPAEAQDDVDDAGFPLPGSSSDAGAALPAFEPEAGAPNVDAGATNDLFAGERPEQVCSSPLELADISQPTHVIGNGTPESCTEAPLRAAVAEGGVITFDCGPGITTISINEALVAPWDKDTTLDGEDRIVLDGQGETQILRAENMNFRVNDRTLTVQRLAMRNGHDVGTGFKERDGEKDCAWGYKEGGGGAIYTRDVNIHVWGVVFEGNRGPELGPDVAGGAIYALGAKKLVVANSVFRDNQAANGGAIGLLHTSAELYNVVFENNQATGTRANFAHASGCPVFNHAEQGGAGGLGGAFYADGQDPGDHLCGVRMSDNVAGNRGGGVFRSTYWGLIGNSPKQNITWDEVTFERNHSMEAGGGAAFVNYSLFTLTNSRFVENTVAAGDGGAIKLEGVTIHFEDVELTDNEAPSGGGIAHGGVGPEGAGVATGMRVSENLPDDYSGDFPR